MSDLFITLLFFQTIIWQQVQVRVQVQLREQEQAQLRERVQVQLQVRVLQLQEPLQVLSLQPFCNQRLPEIMRQQTA